MKKKWAILILMLVFFEVLVYILAVEASPDHTLVFQLAARYSARISLFIYVGLLSWLAYKGLVNIYDNSHLRNTFKLSFSGLVINHIIHFYFLFTNFQVHGLDLLQPRSILGVITYFSLIVTSIFLWITEDLNRRLYLTVWSCLVIAAIVFLGTYIGRLNKAMPEPSSPYLFIFLIALLISLLIANAYRISVEIRDSLKGGKQKKPSIA
ncbi:MAG: hypothetical protein RIC35_06875 [Marinoscillum sp.]